MVFLKSAWIWVKNFWYVPMLLILGIVVLIGSGGKSRWMIGLLDRVRSNYRREREIERDSEEVVQQRRVEIDQQYQRETEAAERKYDAERDALDAAKEKKQQELSNRALEELNEILKKEFGIKN